MLAKAIRLPPLIAVILLPLDLYPIVPTSVELSVLSPALAGLTAGISRRAEFMSFAVSLRPRAIFAMAQHVKEVYILLSHRPLKRLAMAYATPLQMFPLPRRPAPPMGPIMLLREMETLLSPLEAYLMSPQLVPPGQSSIPRLSLVPSQLALFPRSRKPHRQQLEAGLLLPQSLTPRIKAHPPSFPHVVLSLVHTRLILLRAEVPVVTTLLVLPTPEAQVLQALGQQPLPLRVKSPQAPISLRSPLQPAIIPIPYLVVKLLLVAMVATM